MKGAVYRLSPENPLSLKMGLFTMASGLQIIKTATGFRNGQMELGMKECGKTVKPAGKANFGTSMETSLKASGKTIKLMDLEFILIQMELITLVFGRTTCSMEKEKSFGWMEASTLETTN